MVCFCASHLKFLARWWFYRCCDVVLHPQVGAGAPGPVGQPNAGEVILLEVRPEHPADRAAALGPAG